MMSKYRKKPVVIEAERYNGGFDGAKNIKEFLNCEYKISKDSIIIKTLEGNMTAQLGDWIIKGLKGEFYPCKPDIFEQTYDKVAEE